MSCHPSATETNLLGLSSASARPSHSHASSESTERPKRLLFNRHKVKVNFQRSFSRSSRLQSSRRIKLLRKIEIIVFSAHYGGMGVPILRLTLASALFLHLPSFQLKLKRHFKTGNLKKLFKFFSQEFRHLSTLSTLTIQYSQLKFFSVSLIEPLLLSFRYLSSLFRLLVHFDENKTLPIEFIPNVFSALRYLSSSLRALNLKFNASIYSFSIFESIKKLSALTALAIDIQQCNPNKTYNALLVRQHNLHHNLTSTDQRSIDEKLFDGYPALGRLSSLTTLALSTLR